MIEELKEDIAAGRAVVVVGTGASLSATASTTASWPGLIRNGVEYARRHNGSATADWAALVEMQLEYGSTAADTATLVTAASMVAGKVQELGSQAFANWLNESVGVLSPTDRSWPDAITKLPCAVITTNYDKVLEITSGRASVDWTQATDFQTVFSGKNPAIGHLHGVYDNPESVILSQDDYAKMLGSDSAQALLKAIASTKTLIYVGFGSGLSDPNFSNLLKWHREIWPVSKAKHFQLCRTSEIDELTHLLVNTSIHPVPYGNDYADLPAFLDQLRPPTESVRLSDSGLVRDVIADARDRLVDRLRESTVIAETVDDAAVRGINELLLPPVLLPVPNADYVRSRNTKDSARIERLDASEEAASTEIVIIAGEGNGGLSSAVGWLLAEATQTHPAAAPIFINFRRCQRVREPLDQQIRDEARSLNLLVDKKDLLPPILLGIDDFSPYVPRISDRVLAEIAKQQANLTVIGCRQGHEKDVLDRLNALGVSAKVRYLGAFNSSDVKELARLVVPARAEGIAETISGILRAEHLPRTPLTVALLIFILSQGDYLAAKSSPTSILEQYVSLLLGRGDPHDDARWGIDVRDRELILSEVAYAAVSTERPSIPEAEVVSALSKLFEQLSWGYSPSEVIHDLVARHVLKIEKGNVHFSRSSYLYLFAARRAQADSSFRNALLERPIYFASILRHYGALSRNDADLLRSLERFLDGWDEREVEGSLYESIPSIEAPADLGDRITNAFQESDIGTDNSGSTIEDTNDASVDDLDRIEDVDPTPFPLVQDDQLPQAARYARTVDLISSILRDSDQVMDSELKERLLRKTLVAWGMTVDALSDDPSFQDMAHQIAQELRFMKRDGQTDEKFDEEITKALPAAYVMGGIAGSLSSTKLSRPLETTIDDDGFRADAHGASAAAIFLYDVRDRDWAQTLERALTNHVTTWIARGFLSPLLMMRFFEVELSALEETQLASAISSIALGRYKFDSDQEWKQQRSNYEQQLRRRRQTYRRRPISSEN